MSQKTLFSGCFSKENAIYKFNQKSVDKVYKTRRSDMFRARGLVVSFK